MSLVLTSATGKARLDNVVREECSMIEKSLWELVRGISPYHVRRDAICETACHDNLFYTSLLAQFGHNPGPSPLVVTPFVTSDVDHVIPVHRDIPAEVCLEIFSFLPLQDKCVWRLLSKKWERSVSVVTHRAIKLSRRSCWPARMACDLRRAKEDIEYWEFAVAAFLVKRGLCDIVEHVVFEDWFFSDTAVCWFTGMLRGVKSVTFDSGLHRVQPTDIPASFILPNSITFLSLSYCSLHYHSIQNMLSPGTRLETLTIVGVHGGAIHIPDDTIAVGVWERWMAQHGLTPGGIVGSCREDYSTPSLRNLTLDLSARPISDPSMTGSYNWNFLAELVNNMRYGVDLAPGLIPYLTTGLPFCNRIRTRHLSTLTLKMKPSQMLRGRSLELFSLESSDIFQLHCLECLRFVIIIANLDIPILMMRDWKNLPSIDIPVLIKEGGSMFETLTVIQRTTSDVWTPRHGNGFSVFGGTLRYRLSADLLARLSDGDYDSRDGLVYLSPLINKLNMYYPRSGSLGPVCYATV
ncbi:hypothetical protein BDZ89DRAFT_1047119 [Hymenopellis radicata]|nr:hypothetical protein BDZ89DRAFT_1047119 [Hymenopellis radicata]